MSRISESGASAISKVEPQARSEQLTANLSGRRVEPSPTKADAIDTTSTEKEIYSQALRDQTSYMRDKRIKILSHRNPAARENIKEIIREGLHKDCLVLKKKASEISDYKRFRAFKPDIGDSARRKAKAKSAALRTSQRLDFATMEPTQKQEAKLWADRLSLSYKGVGVPPTDIPMPEGCRMLNDSETPDCLTMFYDDNTGLLQTPVGCKALLLKEGNDYILAFTGTEVGKAQESGRTRSLRADVVQRLGGYSTMYRDACAITRVLLEQNPTAKIKLFGHSLGGGQAQYALASNIEGNKDRLSCWAFNSAGLSASTLGAIGENRIEASHPLITNVRIEGDPVSPGTARGETFKGVLLGDVWTLHREGARPIEERAHRTPFLQQEIDKAIDKN